MRNLMILMINDVEKAREDNNENWMRQLFDLPAIRQSTKAAVTLQTVTNVICGCLPTSTGSPNHKINDSNFYSQP